jgi:regulator of replication initiation timing
MGENNFNDLINNINNMFNALVLLEKELINYKEQIANLRKQNEALNLEKSEAWECIEMHYKEEIEKLKKQNEILRAALEFYGDIDHWGHTKVIPDDNYVYKIMVQKSDLGDGSFEYKNTNDDSVAGRKAREALKKVEGME